MPSYQQQTRVVPVDIALGGARRIHGEVYLHHGAASHFGDENILDLMNDDAPFFPLRVNEPEAATMLVAKSHVHYMTVAPLRGDERVDTERAAAVRLDVTVELDDGESLSGAVYAELPPGKQRTLDFVNAPGTAFFVLVQRDRDCIVNRSRVQLVQDTVRLSE